MPPWSWFSISFQLWAPRNSGDEIEFVGESRNVLWVIIVMIDDCAHKAAIYPGNGFPSSTSARAARFLRTIAADWPKFRSKYSAFQGSAEAWTRRTWLRSPRSLSSAFRGPCRVIANLARGNWWKFIEKRNSRHVLTPSSSKSLSNGSILMPATR